MKEVMQFRNLTPKPVVRQFPCDTYLIEIIPVSGISRKLSLDSPIDSALIANMKDSAGFIE